MQWLPQWGTAPSSTTLGCNQNVIKVSGEGMIYVPPDQAIITLGVITESKDLSTSQRENAQSSTNIIRSLANLGIPKESIKTTEYRVEPQYDYDNGKQILRGYKTTHLLQVTIENLSQVGTVIDTTVSQGANSVSNIEFSLAHPQYFYQQALSLALLNGHQKALTIARTIGVTLYPIPSLVTETTQEPSPLPRPMVYAVRSESTPIEPGKLQIHAGILAEYFFSRP